MVDIGWVDGMIRILSCGVGKRGVVDERCTWMPRLPAYREASSFVRWETHCSETAFASFPMYRALSLELIEHNGLRWKLAAQHRIEL